MSAKKRFIVWGLALAVAVGAAAQAALAEKTVEGTLVADQRGHISAQMTGERSQGVKEMNVRVGDKVKAGDLLARLDTEQLQADRLIGQRALEEARAAVEVAKSAVARAQLDYDRRAGLKNSPSFNRAAFEDAEVALQSAKSSLESTQSSANRVEAEVARIDLEIRMAEIKAPYDGLVLDVLTNVGAAVTQRSPDLLTLLDLSQVEIAVKLPQADLDRLKSGQNISYAIADGERRTARLRVVLVPPASKDTNPVARLRLDSVDLPPVIRHEQPVRVFLPD